MEKKQRPLPIALAGDILYALPQTFGYDGVKKGDMGDVYGQFMMPLGYQAEKRGGDDALFSFADTGAWLAATGLLTELMRPDILSGSFFNLNHILVGAGIALLAKLGTNFTLNTGNNIVGTVKERLKPHAKTTSRRRK